MKSKIIHILSLLILSICATPAYSTEVDDAFLDSIFQVSEVVVMENRKKEIIPAQSLSGEALQNLNSQSVADALRYFSGVQIKDFGGIGGIKTINIRSMGTHHIGVFYDGIQLGNAQNGQIDLGRYSLDNIEEIQLYNGQKSNIFQGAKDFGSSGTIYIRTRRPRWDDGKRTHLSAQFKTGSFGLVNPEIVLEQRLSHTVSLSASAEFTHADGRYRFRYRRLNLDNTVAYDTTATRQNGDIDAFRAETSIFGFSSTGQWSAKAYFYNSERGIPGAIVNNVFRNGERQWDKNIFVQGSWENVFSRKYQMKINAKYAYDYLHFLRDDPKELYIDNRYHQQETYLSIANLLEITPWWNVSLSTDFQWNKLTSNMSNFVYPTRFTEMVAFATAMHGYGISTQASILGTFLQDRSGNEHTRGRSTSSRNEWSPALFLSWQPMGTHDWHINGFIKKSFRMPTFNDLYYTEVGNKFLKPEYTYQYSFGSNYTIAFNHNFFKSLSLQADAYFNKVTNKIVAYPSGQQFRWTMLNLGEVEIIGTELAAETSAQAGKVDLGLRLNYTFQKARDFTDPTDAYYGDQIPYVPLHSGSVIARADYRGWDFNYSFIYTGQRYNAQENIPANHEQPWYTHDASLYKNFTIKKTNIRAGIELNNIFDQDYEVILNYPMPGRNFKAVIKVTL